MRFSWLAAILAFAAPASANQILKYSITETAGDSRRNDSDGHPPRTSTTQGPAPRSGSRFVNAAGPGDRGNLLGVQIPFLLRMAGKSFASLPAAPRVAAFDPEALQHNPSFTWIGHATFLVRFDGLTFLTDPMFSDRASPLAFAGPQRLAPPGVPIDALPPVDFALISHDHYDHADTDSIRALVERGVVFVTPLGVGELVRDAGGTVYELDWGDSITLGAAKIHCVPAQHFSGRGLLDRDQSLWAGFVVEGPTTRFYHAGDTGYFDGFREIRERFGPIDLAALPIGAYDPREMMRWVHMNPEDAVQAGLDLGAKRIAGMHWGTFLLTEEPVAEPAERFLREATRRGFAPDDVWVMDIGETRRWPKNSAESDEAPSIEAPAADEHLPGN